MEIMTKYHGVIDMNENETIYFQNGLPGFCEEKLFVFLPLQVGSPFWILQSTVTSQLGFVTVDPFLFFNEYELEISEKDKELLKLTSEKDIAVWVILTLKDPFEGSTANLQAPIILNTSTNQAKQIILNDAEYKTKHKLFLENTVK
jgi:flagellar assembly factor FliW